MKTPTVQEQYNLIKEGKGNKGVFMKTVRSLFPEYINQYTSFNDTISILKSKSVLSEGIGGLVTTGKKQDWHAIFKENMGKINEYGSSDYIEDFEEAKRYAQVMSKKYGAVQHVNEIPSGGYKISDWYDSDTTLASFENGIQLSENKTSLKEAKAKEKKPTKEVVDTETKGYDYKDPKNIDNVYGQEFLVGYYAEMKDPKNKDKSVDELKEIVAKNLAKDNQHYIKDGQFGVKGLGYTTEAPGLGTPKESKGKYKSSGMEPVKLKESMNNNDKDEDTGEYDDYIKNKETIEKSKKDFGLEYIKDIYEEMNSGVNYDSTSAVEIKAKVGDLHKIAPYVLDLGDKVTQDNTGAISIFDGNTLVKKFKDVETFLTGIKYKAMKLEEEKLRTVISQLIKEELNIKEIEETGEDAKKKAMTKKIDEEMAKRKKKLKALTTLTELEKDSVNPKKMKELQAEIKKLEVLREKLNKGKKKEIIDEISPELAQVEKEEEKKEQELANIKTKQASILRKPGTQS